MARTQLSQERELARGAYDLERDKGKAIWEIPWPLFILGAIVVYGFIQAVFHAGHKGE